MQKFKHGSLAKACFTLLSLTLLTQTVIGFESNKISYLDGASSSYLYNQSSVDPSGIEASFKLDSKPMITSSTKRINLSLRDSDVMQALRMLADKAGVNIVFGEDISGKVTLDLKDCDLNDAFMAIFRSTRLMYSMDGNTLTVTKNTNTNANASAYSRQNMTVLPIKYVSAANVAEFLNKNLFNSNIFGLSSEPIVTSNPQTNQIVVFGTNADVMAIKRILPVLDTKPIIENFKVNHVTPKEMAMLICDSLFYDSGNDSNKKSEEQDDELEPDEVTLGAGILACRDKTSSSSSSSSDGVAELKVNPLTVSYFPELGQIGVYGGSPEQVNMVSQFITQHDKKQLMAYIELSVIELNETGSKEFSNEWNLWTPFISLGFSPTTGLSTSSTSPFFIFGDEYPVSTTTTSYDSNGNVTGTTSKTDYFQKVSAKAMTYKLQYLIQNGNGRVLTNPKIMVTNGRKATIDMTSDYVKSVTSQVLQSSSSITSATQKTYDIGSDEGLKIEIVPFISPNGYVSLNISPEFSTIKERVYSTGDSGTQEIAATLLQRRDIDLRNVRIKDGETLVLAGLIKETETQTVNKMPLLSDLPLIGPFFRGNSSSKAREELVIVVTPHIVTDNQDVQGGTTNL